MRSSWRSWQRFFERGEGDDGQHVGDRFDDKTRGDRRPVIVQDRDETGWIEIAFADQQSAQLRIAVLLDDKDALVLGNKVEHIVVEREGADAHRIEMNATRFERFE